VTIISTGYTLYMTHRLTTHALCSGYPGQGVLHDVQISASAGEIVGLVGPNGAGKSTLIRVISRTLPIQAGAVHLDGRPLAGWSPQDLARQLAVVATHELPQSGTLTVRQYVSLGRTPHQGWLGTPSPEDAQAIDQAIRQVNALHLSERPFMALSAGERQRAQLARALAQRPSILLLDEPTAHLDVGQQQALLRLLRQVAGQGVTVLVAIHDLNLAATLCDRLVLLAAGQVITQGTPTEVLVPTFLEQAYGHPWLVRQHPISGRPFVFQADLTPPHEQAPLLHLIGGGGALAPIAGQLAAWGYRLQAGYLHEGDSDVLLAQDLGIPALIAPSFAPVHAGRQATLRSWLAKADAVIVADVPFGPGNLGNLEALSAVAPKAAFAVSRLPESERDFTGGAASRHLADLPQQAFADPGQLLARLAPPSPGTWPIDRPEAKA
jgi:iron complex transport system ATP-binding protein